MQFILHQHYHIYKSIPINSTNSYFFERTASGEPDSSGREAKTTAGSSKSAFNVLVGVLMGVQ